MSETSLIGRDRAISLLCGVFGEATKNRSGIVIVEGPVGVGKTELLQAFVEHVAGLGSLVLSAACSRLESDRQFGVLRELMHSVESLSGAESTLSRLDKNTLEVMLPDAPVAEVQLIAGQVHNDFFRVVHALSARQPVVLCVDDVQHIDVATARCLLHAVRRLRSSRVTVVVSYAAVAEPVAAFFNHELLHMLHCRSIRLDLLTPSGVHELLKSGLNMVTDRVAANVYAATGGSPLLVRAVIADRREAGTTDDRLPVPVPGAHFHRAVLRILHQTDESTLALASGVAVLGTASSPILLARLLNLELAVAYQGLGVLESAGLVTDYRFRDPSAATAVREEMAPAQWAALHLRAGELLHEDGAPPRSVAEHLIAAGSARPLWALGVLEEAARLALADEQAEFAEQCLKLATWACSDDGQRLISKAKLLELAWRVDPSAADRHLPYLMNALRHGQLTADPILPLTKYLLWHGQLADAVEALTALTHAAATLSPASAVAVESLWLLLPYTYPPLAQLLSPPTWEGVSQPSMLRATDARHRVAGSLAEVIGNRAGREAVAEVKVLLRNSLTDDPTLETTRLGLLTLLYSDELAETTRLCDELLASVASNGTDTCHALLRAIGAEAALRSGEIIVARRLAESAITTLPLRSWGVVAGLPISTLIIAAVLLDDLPAAASLLEQPMPGALMQTRHGLTYLYARGRYRLAAGTSSAALGDFTYCGELMRAWKIDTPAVVPWRAGAAEAHLAMNDRASARALLKEQLSLVGENQTRVRGATLRLLARTERQVTHRRSSLESAVELLEACGDRYELAHTLLELAMVYGTLGETRQATIRTQMAVSIARQCGFTLPIQAHANINPIPGRDNASRLTHAERRVAALAAQGRTNREIAEVLFITPSTVEQHLTRVFRKLAIRGREELPASIRVSGRHVAAQ